MRDELTCLNRAEMVGNVDAKKINLDSGLEKKKLVKNKCR